MKYIITLFFSFSIVFMGCSTQKKLAEYEGVDIVFGSGGGFTGQEQVYKLNSHGQFSMTDKIKKEEVELEKLSAKNTLELFDQLTELNVKEVDFYYPGNMYYFIKEVNGSEVNQIVWGDDQKKPPKNVLVFYQTLNSYVNKK